MNIVVQKYGGSSVSDAERMRNVAKKIKAKVSNGFKVLAVVSAMGDTTNRLIKLANEVVQKPEPRELDMLLTTGEQISASLLSMVLNEMGIRAKSVNAFQLKLITTSDFTEAQIKKINKDYIYQSLEKYDVLVVTGFRVSLKKVI